MKVVFRADASLDVGSGHVTRCLALGSGLRSDAVEVFLITRNLPLHLHNLAAESGVSIIRLPSQHSVKSNPVYANRPIYATWLGVPWKQDAIETSRAIKSLGTRPDWLVVDHYGLDVGWEGTMRNSAHRLMVIEDLPDRSHNCDLLLDQNLVEHMETRHLGKVPESCVQLLGPEYALLRPEYRTLRERVKAREGKVRRVLIFFGGSDIPNMTGLALAAFIDLGLSDIDVDIVVSSGNPHGEGISRLADGHGNIHVHKDLPTLAHLMADADLALGAVGATSWERLCLGLPAIVVTLADNQRPSAEYLAAKGLIQWLGDADQVDQHRISQALKSAISTADLKEWSARCLEACSGQGVLRVKAHLMDNASKHPIDQRHES